MGDFIQKTPMIRSIKELDNEASIFLIGDNRWNGLKLIKGAEIITGVFDISDHFSWTNFHNRDGQEVEDYYKKTTSGQRKMILDWLSDINWDVFFHNIESEVPPVVNNLIRRSGSGRVCKHVEIDVLLRRGVRSWLKHRINRKRSTFVPVIKGRHDIDSNYDLLESFLNKPIERSYRTWVDVECNGNALDKWNLKEGQYVCLQPGAANGSPTPKTWHTKNFVELSTKLRDKFNQRVVLLGDSGDQEQLISKYTWPETTLNTAGKTSIEELAELISGAACVVAHDSGVMHLANAMNIPLVALYGPTDYTATRPMGKKTKVLFSKTSAFSIMYASNKSEKKLAAEYLDHAAMAGISVAEVVQSVGEIL